MDTSSQVPDLPLREIHLPDAISWWPLALGWWMMLGILLLFLIALLVIRHFQKPTLKKHAAKELSAIEHMFQSGQDATRCLSALSMFLRRVVLSQNHPAETAGLTGTAWLKLLDRSLDEPEFSQGAGQILLTGPYQSNVEKGAVIQLIQLCHKWVERL